MLFQNCCLLGIRGRRKGRKTYQADHKTGVLLKFLTSIPVLFIWEFQTHPSFVNETVSNNGCIATYQVLKEICPNNLLPLNPTYYISLQEMSCSPLPMILDACIEITIMKKRSVCCCLLNCNFDMLRGFSQ